MAITSASHCRLDWLRFNIDKLRAVILWLLLIIIATAAASSSSNHWSFIEALYFAVSSLSTGGLYALPTDSESWKYSMTGFYAAVGVPVGGLAMATIAGFFINTGDINHTIDAIRGLISYHLSLIMSLVYFALYLLDAINVRKCNRRRSEYVN